MTRTIDKILYYPVRAPFRSLKTGDLHIPPVHHWLVPRVLNEYYSVTLVAAPTPIQAQAFRLHDVDPTKL